MWGSFVEIDIKKIIVIILGVILLGGFSYFGISLYKDFNKIAVPAIEELDKVSKEITRYGEILEQSEVSIEEVEIVDKNIEETSDIDIDTYTNYMFMPSGMMVPISGSNLNTSKKYEHMIIIKFKDGNVKNLEVSPDKYESLTIGDKLNVKIYKNDDIKELRPKTQNNIVKVELYYGE